MCRAMQVHMWRGTRVRTCVAPTAMESRWVRCQAMHEVSWPAHKLASKQKRHTTGAMEGVVERVSDARERVLHVRRSSHGPWNVKRVAARLSDS